MTHQLPISLDKILTVLNDVHRLLRTHHPAQVTQADSMIIELIAELSAPQQVE